MMRHQGCGCFFLWSLVLTCSFCLLPGIARGDGGTIRSSEQVGGFRITVFTAPTPVQVGAVDISVLIQDAVTGEPLPDIPVWITLTPAGQPDGKLRSAATGQAATNKLFQAVAFDLPASGRWHVEIEFSGAGGQVRSRFELEVAEPPPRWLEMWLWIGWPVLPIALFSIHQVFGWRARQPGSHTSAAGKRPQG